MKKFLVICGPTATGKTDTGIYLAGKYNGEIVSADSRQVYRKMDIVTGKDIPESAKLQNRNAKLGINNPKFSVGFRIVNEIPIWLTDIVEPDYPFNVGEYSSVARKVLEDILSRNKLPIVVGGTGLYIKSILMPLNLTTIPPDLALRAELDKLSLIALQETLDKEDPVKWQSMNNSDRNNPRRLIRAIEIAKYAETLKKPAHTSGSEHVFKIIGLSAPREILIEKISQRVEQRFSKSALQELKFLVKEYSWNHHAFSSTGYKELKELLDYKTPKEKALENWRISEHKYAKRQMTWFKKMKDIEWFDISDMQYLEKIDQVVGKWYTAST